MATEPNRNEAYPSSPDANGSGPYRPAQNHPIARVWRLLLAVPLLISRGLAYPQKKAFFQRLTNTYQANRINLFLAYGQDYGPWKLRMMALGGVYQYARNVVLYKAPKMWRGFDVHNGEALEKAAAMNKGLVVAGQHIGPQRYSFAAIAGRMGQTLAAMTEQFIDEGQTWIDRVIDDLGEGPDVSAVKNLQLLPVEEPTCALKMVRALKKKGAVMFDLDGNIGVGGEERTLQGTHRLGFFGRDVHVRGGVAYLSHRTGAPILPLISVWGRNGRPEVHYFDPIVPEDGESRQAYEERALGWLYGQLEKVIRQYPTQWEMWPHFYKWLASPPKLDTTAAERLEREIDRLREHIESDDQGLRISVSPSEATVLRMRGKELFVDARNFRFFIATPLCRAALRYLHRGTTLKRLVRHLEGQFEVEQILQEVGRLRILGLLETESSAPAIATHPTAQMGS